MSRNFNRWSKEDEKRIIIGGTVPRHETPIVPVRKRGAMVAQVIVRCRFSALAVIIHYSIQCTIVLIVAVRTQKIFQHLTSNTASSLSVIIGNSRFG